MRTLILIPTYNERQNVAPLTQQLLHAAPHADLLFLDDASPDGTGAALDELHTQFPRLHVHHRPQKSGLGRAYLAGFQWAMEHNYDLLLCMDADLSHDPRDVPRLLNALHHHHLVCGSRYLPGGRVVNWPTSRLALSRFAAAYARLITGMPFTDPTGGFNAYRADALASLPLTDIHSDGYSFQIEMKHRLWSAGFLHTELPVVFTERRNGHSKMSAAIVREAAGLVWRLAARNRFRRHPSPPLEAAP